MAAFEYIYSSMKVRFVGNRTSTLKLEKNFFYVLLKNSSSNGSSFIEKILTEFDLGISASSSATCRCWPCSCCSCWPSSSWAGFGMTLARTLKLAPDKISLETSKMSLPGAVSPGQLLWPADLLPLTTGVTVATGASSFHDPSLLRGWVKLPGVCTPPAGESRDCDAKLSLKGLPTPE